MKIALVGVGGMGSVHFNVYKNMPNIELITCDVRLDMLREKVGDLPIRIYSDMDEMLEKENPDMVDICTPTYLHAEQAIKAMKSGAHVLSEKPMGLNSAECERILAVVKETGKRYMVAQVVRFMAPYIYLRNAIECGKYGKLESLTLQRFSQTPMWSWENWMLDAKKSGQVAIDLMIHDVDFMQYVLGEPKQISGAYRELDDRLTNYGFANYIYDGFAVLVESGWYKDQKTRFQANFKAVFENGNIILDNSGKLYDCNEVVDFSDVEKFEKTQINISNVDGYAAEIQYFIDCINFGKPNDLALGESSAASIALVERTLDRVIKI